jgi:hypothetical protein
MATTKPEPRTAEQNARMWAMLTDLSKQLPWPVNGSMVKITPEDWKDILTASLTKHHRMAQGIDGGFVILGMRTSKMNKHQMTELIELMFAFGAEHEIEWTDPTIIPVGVYAEA